MLPQHTSSSPNIWIIFTASSWLWQYFMINQTKVYICSNSPVLNRWLLLWEVSSCPPVFSLNLLFWDDPELNVRSLFILQVSLTFYKLTVKTLAVSKLGGCRCCSWSPSLSLAIDPSQQKTLFVWALVKEVPGTGLWINTVCNFQTRKSVVQLNRMLWKFLLLCQGIQENSHKDNVKSNFLGKIWESKKSSRLYFSLSGYQRP